MSDIKEVVVKNIRELLITWGKRETYLLRGDLTTLKDTFRRLAFNFNRIANIPTQENELLYSCELQQLANLLRKASASDFRVGLGFNPLERITVKIDEAINIAEEINKDMGSSAY